MAISKKSLGKVLAISMASAMAMSSLSAALVSVSAVQDPALASNGNVGFKGSAQEDEILNIIGGQNAEDFGEVDAIVGQSFDLSELLSESAYETRLEYTDSDGLKQELDVTKVTYRISSGGSYAKINKEGDSSTLVAQNSGTATLQVKVTADVELGGDKNDKEVTFTHNITINVHKNGEIGLQAYKGTERLSTDDLNNLAAYNSENITFKLVSFHKIDASTFYAKLQDARIGDDGTLRPDTPTPPTTDTPVEAVGGTETLAGVLNTNGDAVDTDAYNALNDTDALMTITSAEQAAIIANAKSTAIASTTDTVAAGTLYRTKVAESTVAAASNTDGETTTPDASQTHVVVYFATEESALPTVLAHLVEAQSDMYFKDGLLGDDTTGTLVKVWKVKAPASPVTLKKQDIGDATAMNAILDVAKNGADTPIIGGTTTPPEETQTPLEKAIDRIKAVIEAANTNNITLDTGLEQTITNALTVAADGTVSVTNWDTFKALIAIPGKEAGQGTQGFVVNKEGFNTTTAQKKAAIPYTTDTVLEDLGTSTDIDTIDQNTTLADDTLYRWTGKLDNTATEDTTYYFAKQSQGGTVDLTATIGDNVALSSVLEENSAVTAYWDDTNKGLTGTQGTGDEVVVYKVVDDLSNLNQTGETDYTEQEWDAAVSAAMTEKSVVTVAGESGAADTYYITTADATTANLTANSEVKDDNNNTLFTLASAESDVVAGDPAIDPVTFDDLFYTGSTEVTGKESLDNIIANANTPATTDTPTGGSGDSQGSGTQGGGEATQGVALAAVNMGANKKLESVRFYAGSGAELFDLVADQTGATNLGNGKWEKGTKSNQTKGFAVNADEADASFQLFTKGTTGNASVKARVNLEDGTFEEYVLNIKVVKAADFGSAALTVDKDGSKTLVTGGTLKAKDAEAERTLARKSLSGYELRTTGNVTVEDGTVGVIDADGNVTVNGGRTGNIVEATSVTVDGGATVGDIIDAGGDVSLTEGATAGKITTDIDADENNNVTGTVTINDATVAGIEANCDVDIKGGEVNGSIIADGKINITSVDEDEDGDLMDVTINGSVISRGQGRSQITIDNESDEGGATITIRGDVSARYANVESDPSVQIGSSSTSGTISIGGAVQGEHIVLGGNGLVTLGAVNAVNEVDHSDEEGVVVDSTLEFQGFNAGINNINKFANVTVSEGTVNVISPLTTTTLDVQSDTQIVLAAMTVEDITGDGNIVVPVGELTVNGNVDDTPSLTLLGDVAVNTVAYRGDRGLTDKFDLGGLTVKAERQTNGVYDYIVTQQELYGVRAVGKNVTVGQGQAKSVTVVADAALPQGATIAWASDDAEVATVEGNGNTATITGVDIGSVDVTATIVDANGRDLGYENATFNVEVLYADTIEVVGSEIALDTKAVGMDVGQSYSFLVRENSDTDNITLSYDSNIVDVALAQADYNGRGALYTITAKANGSTNVTVNYKGASSSVAVKVGGFKLDTAAKDLAPGQTYSFLAKNVPADQAANVKLEYDANVATVALAQADYNGRGALFTVTGNQVGSTEIKATYNNEEAIMAVNVVEYTGRMTLDTASYTMPFGGTYTIGVKIEQNGRQLSGEEVNAMIARDELRVRDSRTGTIINAPQVLANGNVRVTGKSTEGTTYVLFEVVQNGQVVTHASVGVTVRAGATAEGSSRRSISQW